MYRQLTVKAVSVALTLVLVTAPLLNTAQAGVVSTQDAFALEARQAQIDEVRRLLAQTNVHEALIRYGVEPTMAAQRVATLTDAELTTLEANLNELPSGGTGLVEVVGIVAIVIIVLELIGVTDVFKKI